MSLFGLLILQKSNNVNYVSTVGITSRIFLYPSDLFRKGVVLTKAGEYSRQEAHQTKIKEQY